MLVTDKQTERQANTTNSIISLSEINIAVLHTSKHSTPKCWENEQVVHCSVTDPVFVWRISAILEAGWKKVCFTDSHCIEPMIETKSPTVARLKGTIGHLSTWSLHVPYRLLNHSIYARFKVYHFFPAQTQIKGEQNICSANVQSLSTMHLFTDLFHKDFTSI